MSSISFFILNLNGNLFLQHGHLQKIKEIDIKTISNITPITLKNLIVNKNEPIKLKKMEANKQARENFFHYASYFL